MPPAHPPLAGRRVLFLQGISTPLFYRLGKRLRRDGADVHRINICIGDLLFWPASATNFRAPFSQWSAFLVAFVENHAITDIVLFGDCRPYHRVAIARARARGIAVHIFEEGILRPHWITMESDAAWRAPGRLTAETLPILSTNLPSISEHRNVTGGFAQRACWDVAFHICNTLAGFTFPHYRRHRPGHPLVEGLGWLRRAITKRAKRQAAVCTVQKLIAENAAYFLLPLQLDSDAQIRFRSSFANMGDVLEQVMMSFSRNAPENHRLVVKTHPLDNGLVNRDRQVAAIAERHGLAGRVDFMDGGHLPTVIEHSRGVVVVNSTVGLTALHQKRPTFALAQPIYKLTGLTSGANLDAFWASPQSPKAELIASFEKLLLQASQINGSFFNFEGIDLAIEAIVVRLQAAPVSPS